MSDSGITEFEWLNPEQVDLVGNAANKFTALVAKAGESTSTKPKGSPMSKLERKLQKALGVDLSGGATTAASRQSNDALDRLLRQAGTQTRENLADHAAAQAAVRSVLKAFDKRVTEAQAAVAAAADEFQKARSNEELRSALKARFHAKMVIAENTGANKGNLPNTAAIFGKGAACTTYTIGDDSQVRGV